MLTRLIKAMREFRPDVVLGSQFGDLVFAAPAGRACRALVLGGVRSDGFYELRTTGWRGPLLLKLAHGLIANSNMARENLVSQGVNPAEIAVLPNVIDLADFESRAVVLPPKSGYFTDLAAVSGKLIYRRLPRAGSGEDKGALVYYDLEKREDKTILDDVDEAILAGKDEKVLVRRKNEYAIIEPKEGQKFEKKLPISGLETVIVGPMVAGFFFGTSGTLV